MSENGAKEAWTWMIVRCSTCFTTIRHHQGQWMCTLKYFPYIFKVVLWSSCTPFMLLVSSLSTTENNGLQISPKLAKLFIDQITEYQNYHNIVVVSIMQFWPYCFSYGDKVPRTMYGRLFSVVWILTGVCLISIFTAAITSAITVSSVDPGCKSTQGKRVSNVFLPLLQLKIIWLIVSAAVFLTTYA